MRDDVVAECRAVVDAQMPGYDFTREILLTDHLAVGDTVLLHRGSAIVGYALCHTAPLVEGRVREELRVLKLVLSDEADLDAMLQLLADYARRTGVRRVALRVQGGYVRAYERCPRPLDRSPHDGQWGRGAHRTRRDRVVELGSVRH